MIKCTHKGEWTCISRTGLRKKSYPNADRAIHAAKLVNLSDPKPGTKLVAYKCSQCFNYHLLTVKTNKYE